MLCLPTDVFARSFMSVEHHECRLAHFEASFCSLEGGQNLATENDGNGKNDSHHNLTQLTILANSHPRMRSIYKESFHYFSALSPGSLFNHFSYMGQGGKYGNWGLTQWQDQQIGVPTPESAPKYAALYEIWQAQGLAPPPPPSR